MGLTSCRIAVVGYERDEPEQSVTMKEFSNIEPSIDASIQRLVDQKQVHLNVGGRGFVTSMSTLYAYPKSKLSRIAECKAEESEIFIDRDGVNFGLILTFLQDGTLYFPDMATRLSVYQEAQYFHLKSLMKICMLGSEILTPDMFRTLTLTLARPLLRLVADMWHHGSVVSDLAIRLGGAGPVVVLVKAKRTDRVVACYNPGEETSNVPAFSLDLDSGTQRVYPSAGPIEQQTRESVRSESVSSLLIGGTQFRLERRKKRSTRTNALSQCLTCVFGDEEFEIVDWEAFTVGLG
eukprot:242719_1